MTNGTYKERVTNAINTIVLPKIDEVVKEYVIEPYITNNWCSDQENYSENNYKIKDVTKYIADYLAVYLSEEADMWVAVSKRMKDKQ